MDKKRPSLRTIAEEAGVSKMAVSLALRDSPRIPSATRNRIKLLAQKQNYRPNPELSRLLATIRRSNIEDRGLPLACITTGESPDIWRESPTETAYWQGACKRAESYGFYMKECWLDQPHMKAQRMSDILWNRGIKGVIIPPVQRVFTESNRDVRMDLDWDRFCAVTIGDPLTSPELNRVLHDHYTSMFLALTRLMELGYRRIGLCLHEHMDLTVNQRWQAGYRMFRTNHAIERLDPLIRSELTAGEVREWLLQNKIEAILSAGHNMPKFFREAGLKLGRDVAYADLDLYPTAPQHEGVSGIMQNSEMLGMAAVDMVFSAQQRNQTGVPEIPIVTQVRGTWINAKTTPPARSA